MTGRRQVILWFGFVSCILGVLLPVTQAYAQFTQDTVRVTIDTSAWVGQKMSLIFRYVNLPMSNTPYAYVDIWKFYHDGRIGSFDSEGYVESSYHYARDGASPDTLHTKLLISGCYHCLGEPYYIPVFQSVYAVNFDSLGTSLSFSCVLHLSNWHSERPKRETFSVCLLGQMGLYPFTTEDPLGTNTLFSYASVENHLGELSVFAPMQFVAPDSLVLESGTTGVSDVPDPPGRLRILSMGPNPTHGNLVLRYSIERVGIPLMVRIYDCQGRLVRVAFDGRAQDSVGRLEWNGRDEAGRNVPAGIYFVRISSNTETAVRKVVVLH